MKRILKWLGHPIVILMVISWTIINITKGHLMYMIALWILLDVCFTQYIFHLHKKKNVLNYNHERNVIPRTILKYSKGGFKILIPTTLNILILGWLTYKLMNVGYIIFGAMALVNYIHLISIKERHKNWNNEKYWYYMKKKDDVTIYPT